MKFDNLYKKIFVVEQNDAEEVADPADFNDVEPLPVPEPAASADLPSSEASGMSTETNFSDYIMQSTELAAKLVSDKGNDLLSVLSTIDKPGTPYENIYSSLKSGVLRASEALSDLASQLIAYKNIPKR